MKKLKKNATRVCKEAVKPVLRFTPTAWAKLVYFRDHGHTEIGGFGITSDDLLLIEDFVTVKQEASLASIAFDDEAVADFFEAQVDQGRKPEQFARIWLHTHPGDSPHPSSIDEETFHRVFGGCEWAVLFILAQGGNTYARLRFNIGPGGETEIPVKVDFHTPFSASDHEAWKAEYEANIKVHSIGFYGGDPMDGFWLPEDWKEEFEAMEPEEREFLLDELKEVS
jgi:proteasome lid subunit RPN8/RPN11